MDTLQNPSEHKTIAKIEFLKGSLVGTMVGMAIAAFTYHIVDRSLKEPPQSSHPPALPDWRTAA